MEMKLEECKRIGYCDELEFYFLFGIQADYQRMSVLKLLRKTAAAI
jgi:hypothetical protein